MLKSVGKVHSVTIRDVKLEEGGEVKLVTKDFQTEASLTVKGQAKTCAASADVRSLILQVQTKNQTILLLVSRATGGVHKASAGPNSGGGVHCHAGV